MSMRGAISILAVSVTLVTLTACLDETITGQRPLSFNLSVDSTTIDAGGAVTFEYSATGTGILGIIIDYGDGVVDSTDIVAQARGGNVVEFSDNPQHVYEVAGVYRVVGRLEATSGSRSDEVEVTVRP